MAEGALWDLAGKIIEHVGESAVEKVVSWWGVKHDLKKFEKTMRVIQAVLVDAEKQQAMGELDPVSKEWLRRLRKVLYRADDLFDEALTVKQQKSGSLNEGKLLNQLSKKVLLPFSKSGPIFFDFHVVGEIKSIRKELNAIKRDLEMTTFKLVACNREEQMLLTSRFRSRWETAYLVSSENIVGREQDKNNIIEMLFSEPNIAEGSKTVIPIVGFGGIGKTTLAQLAFNDERVQNHFELTKWVWIPEKDSKKDLMGKIFTSFTGRNYHGLSLEQLHLAIRDSIKDKRYMLVLDNVWDESRGSWLDLMNLLGCGKRGSKIIVTTRSLVVARNVGTIPEPYILQILSDEESWDLFQKLAFKPGSNPNLIPIGKEIVKKCANVPLAIKTIGCALYNEDNEIEWRQLRDVPLSNIDRNGSIDIIPALKLSYDQLPSQLKQCFAYCALFKKDAWFTSNFVINRWMAQGFIKPSNEDCDMDLQYVGHRYFEELSSRNFFQDIVQLNAPYGAKFRVHHLFHDLAAHVAGDENLVADVSIMTEEKFHSEIRYVGLYFTTSDPWEALSLSLVCRVPGVHGHIQRWESMLSNFIHMRTLELMGMMIESVPNSIGVLWHLRRLRIFRCPRIRCLSPSITRLWNLQQLILEDCSELTVLPKGFSRLINLKIFFTLQCNLLTETPPGFGKLKSLQRLSHFMVGENNGLDALTNMNLRRSLVIDYCRWREDTIVEARRANLKSKQLLLKLTLRLGYLDTTPDDAVLLLEELQPPQSLKALEIVGYKGERFPQWMEIGFDTQLPILEVLKLESFEKCRFLSSSFSQLPCLKRLFISGLVTMEYIDVRGRGDRAYEYFPCLEYLKLSELRQLKGWSRVAGNGGGERHDRFPRLETLEIYKCPELKSMPLTPRLQKLIGKDTHKSLLSGREGAVTSFCPDLMVLNLSSVCDLDCLVINGMDSLEMLKVSDCRQLISIIVEPPTTIKHLELKGCERLREIQGLQHLSSTLEILCVNDCELPTSLDCLTVLQSLEIRELPDLTALPRSISQLTTLHTLDIADCPELSSLPGSFGNLTQLRRLQIRECPQMSIYIGSSSFGDHLHQFALLERLIMDGFPDITTLPVSIVHLSHLCELTIGNCPQLTGMPQLFTNLTALQKLEIYGCPHLSNRCKDPDGEDWPLIQHIPRILLRD